MLIFSPLMTVLLLNRVENIVANDEIAHYKQFHIRHNVFKSCLLQRRLKASICIFTVYLFTLLSLYVISWLTHLAYHKQICNRRVLKHLCKNNEGIITEKILFHMSSIAEVSYTVCLLEWVKVQKINCLFR